jgi:hypothetical protein
VSVTSAEKGHKWGGGGVRFSARETFVNRKMMVPKPIVAICYSQDFT